MRIPYFFIALISLGMTGRALAQRNIPLDGKFKEAVAEYKRGNYNAAMTKLAPLASNTVVYSFSEYAYYYYALSAYQSGKYKESRQMLLQLVSRFPNWPKMDEVNYLLGANALATGQWNEGQTYFAKIKSNGVKNDIPALKQNYLKEIKDIAVLTTLQKQNPDDRLIATELILAIQNSPKSKAKDLQFAEQLMSEYKISDKETAGKVESKEPNKQLDAWSKGYFNVSTLLPFRLSEFNSNKKRTNQFAYDYYLGMVMAKRKLKEEGIEINLWAYDIGTDAKILNSTIQDKTFQTSDLLVGPLYPATMEVATAYSERTGTYMLNPLSTDGSTLKKGAPIYLAHPSVGTQMKKAADFMRTVAPMGPVTIYYGNTSKDSSMAFSYLEELKRKGLKSGEFLKVRTDREWLEANMKATETNKPGHFAIFSSDTQLGSIIIDVLRSRKLTDMPLLATSTSFDGQRARINRYGIQMYLIETDYMNREKESVRKFQAAYWELTNTFPSVYSCQGYDHLLFFGRMMSQYKNRISNGLALKKYDQDYLLSGFDFTGSNENQTTLIYRINGSRWEAVK
jgi:hypothetical protein